MHPTKGFAFFRPVASVRSRVTSRLVEISDLRRNQALTATLYTRELGLKSGGEAKASGVNKKNFGRAELMLAGGTLSALFTAVATEEQCESCKEQK